MVKNMATGQDFERESKEDKRIRELQNRIAERKDLNAKLEIIKDLEREEAELEKETKNLKPRGWWI